MIAYVQGVILEKTDAACLVLCPGGVGYEVRMHATALAGLPPAGEEVALYASTVVREDALELYGFTTWDERNTFQTLLTISKVGPKLSLAILALFPPDELRGLVGGDDVDALKQVPGIGPKSAQRIFLELQYKIKAQAVAKGPDLPTDAAASVFRDALAGLTNLGYSDDEARLAVEGALKAEPDLDVAGALRAALRQMQSSSQAKSNTKSYAKSRRKR